MVYYATFPIQEQAKRANWNYDLKAVYTIGILDFVFDEDKDQPDKFRYDIKLQDIDTNKTFYDKLTFIYLEMPKFKKSIQQLESRFDKWMYVIRNLNRLDRIPEPLREKIFERLFEAAEIAKFNPQQVRSYHDSLKYYRDLKNSIMNGLNYITEALIWMIKIVMLTAPVGEKWPDGRSNTASI